jgi:AraC-like DNA-binding protein
MLREAYGDDALSQMTYEWIKRFKNSRTSTDDDERSGRPSTSKSETFIAQVTKIIRENRRLSVREVAEEVGISIGSCHTILTEGLGIHRFSAKFVPRLLIDDQKPQRFSIYENFL